MGGSLVGAESSEMNEVEKRRRGSSLYLGGDRKGCSDSALTSLVWEMSSDIGSKVAREAGMGGTLWSVTGKEKLGGWLGNSAGEKWWSFLYEAWTDRMVGVCYLRVSVWYPLREWF